MYETPRGSDGLIAPPNTYEKSSTKLIGWIVEKTSRSGWRMKWRRLRVLTTRASVSAARILPGDSRRHQGGRGVPAGGAAAVSAAGTSGLGRSSPAASGTASSSLGGAPV